MNTHRRIIQALGPSILLTAFWACSSDDSTTKPHGNTTSGTSATTGSGTAGAGTSGTGTTGAATTGATSAGATTSGATGTTGTTGAATSGTTGAGGAGSTGSTATAGGSNPATTTGTTTTGGGGTGAGGSGQGSGTACGNPTINVANAVISSFDGMSEPLASAAVAPGGLWGAEHGGTSTATLAVADSGDSTQGKAAHLTGMTGPNASADYADMSTTLSGTVVATKPSGVDASTYSGISFKVKPGAGNMAQSLMIKLQNDDSIPACGGCVDGTAGKECYAGYTFTASVPAGTTFGTVQVPFASVNAATWGNHSGMKIDPHKIISVSIIVLPGVTAYDLWIDDVQFYH